MNEQDLIDSTIHTSRVWFRDLMQTLELPDDEAGRGFHALRAGLHAIRDRLPITEAVHLGAQLPTLVRGVYYEDWRPSRTPAPIHDVDGFLRRVAEDGHLAGETEASHAVGAVMRVLRRHVTAGEIDDVLAALPADIRALLGA